MSVCLSVCLPTSQSVCQSVCLSICLSVHMYLPVWYTILSHHTGGSGSMTAKRHALIMDEVDGMAGNEDRGGVQVILHY